MPCWPRFAIASDAGVPSTVVVEVTSGAVLPTDHEIRAVTSAWAAAAA
jgi:hypothetical protein